MTGKRFRKYLFPVENHMWKMTPTLALKFLSESVSAYSTFVMKTRTGKSTNIYTECGIVKLGNFLGK